MKIRDGTPNTSGKRGTVKLSYGLARSDRRMRHISEVENGGDCDCICPKCETALIAHQGEVNQHHFAHRPEYERACVGAVESMLHRLAKEAIESRKGVVVPDLVARFRERTRVEFSSRWFDLDEVVLEQRTGDIKPDIIARKRLSDGTWRELLIEIWVAHRCGAKKIAKIRALGISCIEVDLSKMPRDPTREQVERFIAEAASTWLFNLLQDEIDSKLKAAVEREEAEARERAQQELRRKEASTRRAAERLASLFTKATSQGYAAWAQDASRVVRWIHDGGLGSHIGVEVRGAACFAVVEEVWQAFLLEAFLLRHATYLNFPTMEVLEFMRTRGLVHPEFRGFISPEFAETVRLIEPTFGSPYEAIEEYLEKLLEADLFVRPGKKWRPKHGVGDTANAKIAKATEARKRVQEVETRLRKLLANFAWGNSFDVAKWMATVPPGENLTPVEMAVRSQWNCDLLINHLTRLEAMIEPNARLEEELLGLPLEALLTSRRKEREAAEAERLRQAAEKARLKAEEAKRMSEERRAKLRDDAVLYLGEQTALEWLARPRPSLGGQSADSIPEMAERDYVNALSQLRHDHSTLVAREERDRAISALREQLELEAANWQGRDRGKFWVGAMNRLLGNRRPRDVCITAEGLEECRQALRQEPYQPGR